MADPREEFIQYLVNNMSEDGVAIPQSDGGLYQFPYDATERWAGNFYNYLAQEEGYRPLLDHLAGTIGAEDNPLLAEFHRYLIFTQDGTAPYIEAEVAYTSHIESRMQELGITDRIEAEIAHDNAREDAEALYAAWSENWTTTVTLTGSTSTEQMDGSEFIEDMTAFLTHAQQQNGAWLADILPYYETEDGRRQLTDAFLTFRDTQLLEPTVPAPAATDRLQQAHSLQQAFESVQQQGIEMLQQALDQFRNVLSEFGFSFADTDETQVSTARSNQTSGPDTPHL